MDDDITFGASVWATAEPAEIPLHSKPKPPDIVPPPPDEFDDGGFNDFEDFAPAPAATMQDDLKDDDDDDFGDFGDFGDAEIAPISAFQAVEFQEPFPVAGPSSHRPWKPLQVDPFPSRPELEEEIYDIIGPVWENEDISRITTDDPMREVEGVGQILITSSSRQMHKVLLQTPPPSKPPNWTRSRIRRQHLIALGIPVNLDEVLPKANGKPLPMLEIHTRPMSAPPGNRSYPNSAAPQANHGSRSGTPQPGPQNNLLAQFGPRPELDTARITKLLEHDIESLTMQPLPNLERHLAELKQQTANVSNLLTYLLQSRDALQQDSETYNGLIAELVSEVAQKVKSGKPGLSRTMSRRGSGMS